MWATSLCQAAEGVGAPGATLAIVQWFAAIFALGAVVVGVVHFLFAKRKAKEAYLERVRQACAHLNAVKHPLWRSACEEQMRKPELRQLLSQLEHLISSAERKLSQDEVSLLREFADLCGKPVQSSDRNGYRQKYKEVVKKLESRIEKFTGRDMEEL